MTLKPSGKNRGSVNAWQVKDRIEELELELSRARNGFSRQRIEDILKLIDVNKLVLNYLCPVTPRKPH